MLPIHRTPTHVFNYDEIPPGHYFKVMQKGSAVQRFWHQEKFKEVASRIPNGSKVLDIGCGPGSFLWILAQEKPEIQGIGVDIASSQIQYAIENVGKSFPNGTVSFQMLKPGAPHLPFEDESFDAITSIEVIEHIHPHLAFNLLEEAKRVLKPNGKMVLTTPNYRSLWPLIEFILEYVSPVKYHDQHISKFTPNSAVKFMETLGMTVTQVDSLFMLAPFIAFLGKTIPDAVLKLEKKLDWKVGSLLVLESEKIKWG